MVDNYQELGHVVYICLAPWHLLETMSKTLNFQLFFVFVNNHNMVWHLSLSITIFGLIGHGLFIPDYDAAHACF